MRIGEEDFASLRPVRGYREACYPVGMTAGGQEPWEDSRWPAVVARYGRRGLAAAAILASSCATQGELIVPFPIDEALGRQIIIERFQAQGVTFEQDYHYLSDGIEFEADGFDESLGIGFEYNSEDDNPYYVGDAELLSEAERAALEEGMASGGDAIGYFDHDELMSEIGYVDDEVAARAALEAQVDEFIEFLRSSGRL